MGKFPCAERVRFKEIDRKACPNNTRRHTNAYADLCLASLVDLRRSSQLQLRFLPHKTGMKFTVDHAGRSLIATPPQTNGVYLVEPSWHQLLALL